MKNLEVINPEDNELTSLPDSFTEMAALKSVILEGNRLQKLPATMSKLKLLEEIDLSGTDLNEASIQELRGMFPECRIYTSKH